MHLPHGWFQVTGTLNKIMIEHLSGYRIEFDKELIDTYRYMIYNENGAIILKATSLEIAIEKADELIEIEEGLYASNMELYRSTNEILNKIFKRGESKND